MSKRAVKSDLKKSDPKDHRRIESRLAENLSWLMARERLTERTLAKKIGLSQSSINKLKNGRLKLKIVQVLSFIADELHVSVDDLINKNFRQTVTSKDLKIATHQQLKVIAISSSKEGIQTTLIDLDKLPFSKTED